MSSGGGFQVLVNLAFLASMVAIWIKLLKPAKDHPRLSRGLQLLQSKIAILEDLSDQVERQVQQVTQLIEAKNKDLQSAISQADDLVRKMDGQSVGASGAPYDREATDRQNTAKYVRAAQMAHQGASVDDILSELDISRAEAEFVIKVNRNQMQYSLEHLPGWAKTQPAASSQAAAIPQAAATSHPVAAPTQTPILKVRDASISPLAAEQAQPKVMANPQAQPSRDGVKKVVFPRIDINKNLG